MGQLAVYGLLAIVLAALLFLLATRFLPAGEQIAPPLRDEPPWNLPPDRELRAEDVDSVRLPVSLRGYRFAETDVLLDRLAGELRARDLEIARLRGERGPSPQPLVPLSFAPPGAAGPEPDPEPGSWAPSGATSADAPQPPPFADEERPVTDTPVTPVTPVTDTPVTPITPDTPDPAVDDDRR